MAVRSHLRLVTSHPEQDTAAALSELLQMTLRGELAGVVVSFMRPGGAEDCVTTGAYRARPSEAVRACVRASMILTQATDAERNA